MPASTARGSAATISSVSSALAICGVLAACSSSGAVETPKDPAAAPLTIAFPSTPVAAGQEKTQCVVVRRGNTAPLHIGAVHNVLGDTSHHLIVYRVNDTVEQPEPLRASRSRTRSIPRRARRSW